MRRTVRVKMEDPRGGVYGFVVEDEIKHIYSRFSAECSTILHDAVTKLDMIDMGDAAKTIRDRMEVIAKPVDLKSTRLLLSEALAAHVFAVKRLLVDMEALEVTATDDTRILLSTIRTMVSGSFCNPDNYVFESNRLKHLVSPSSNATREIRHVAAGTVSRARTGVSGMLYRLTHRCLPHQVQAAEVMTHVASVRSSPS